MNPVLRPIAPDDVDALQELILLRGYPNAHIATAFWLRQGFEPTGEERPYQYDKLESTARLYEKQLT